MALSENPVVVQQASKIISMLAGDSATAQKLLSNDVLQAVSTLIASTKQVRDRARHCQPSLLLMIAHLRIFLFNNHTIIYVH